MATATIIEWDMVNQKPVTAAQAVSLIADFDPQSLELTYSPTGTTAASYDKQTGKWSKSPPQQTGQSATLAVTLLFDTSTLQGISVQAKTEPMVRLTLPRKLPAKSGDPSLVRRVIKFQWGTFLFFGCVESMSETIDFFTDTGVPVRSSVHLTMSQVSGSEQTSNAARAPHVSFGAGAGIGASASAGVGTSAGASVSAGASITGGISASASVSAGVAIGTNPLTLSLEGDTIQSITARAGVSVSWKVVAAANNIDNPRLLRPGTILSAGAGAQLNSHAG